MKVYTASYSKVRELDLPFYQIAVSCPKGMTPIKTIKELMPEWAWVNRWNGVKNLSKNDPRRLGVIDWYTLIYTAKMNSLGKEKILSLLEDGGIYCCWCPAGEFCHRQILADILKSYGVEVEEVI